MNDRQRRAMFAAMRKAGISSHGQKYVMRTYYHELKKIRLRKVGED